MKITNYIPDLYKNSIYDIDYTKLYSQGFRIILTDLDNTLVSYDETLPNEDVLNWLDNVKKIGFEVIVTSNNKKSRVKKFCDECNILGIYWSLKPFSFGFKRALKNKNYQKNEILILGDQLLTDVLASKRCGYYCILIKAIKRKTEKWVTRFNRKREIKILKKIQQLDEKTYNLKLEEYVRDNYGY